MRALSRQPADRYESMEAFAHALAATGAQSAITPVALPRVGPPPVRRRRPRYLVLAVLLIGIGARRGRVLDAAAGPERGDRWPSLPDRRAGCSRCCPSRTWATAGDQYFADGLTEELTSRLAGLGGLRVISRTSAEQYRESPKSLKEIGAELQAGYVLEGSVRWERSTGNPGRVRVTPRLISVADDSPLWGEEYEVELTEVFRVQSEIAQQVTTALDVALRGPEQASLAAAGTATPEAYDFYLRGNEYASRSYSRGNIEAAVDLYRKAVALDSSFALAWARLGRAHSAMYWFYYDRTPARLDSARTAVETALRLSPDLAEGHIARGYYYYWGLVRLRAARWRSSRPPAGSSRATASC